jgi:hypothetical protein
MFKKLFITSCAIAAFQLGPVANAARPESASLGSSSSYSVSPGLTFVGSLVGPSINSYVGIAPVDDRNLFIGVDLGLAVFFPSGIAMNISILPTIWYQFALPRNQNIKLVGGVEFGPAIGVGAVGSAASSGVTYEFLLRPGFIMESSDGMLIGADMKFGTLGGSFVFKPQFNLIFQL